MLPVLTPSFLRSCTLFQSTWASVVKIFSQLCVYAVGYKKIGHREVEVFGLIIYCMLVSMPTLRYYSQNSEMLLRMYESGGWLPFEMHDSSFFVISTQCFLNLKTESVINVQELVRKDIDVGCFLPHTHSGNMAWLQLQKVSLKPLIVLEVADL